MARPKNKQELIEAANTNYEKLLSMIERRTEAENRSGEQKRRKVHRMIFWMMKRKRKHTGDVIEI